MNTLKKAIYLLLLFFFIPLFANGQILISLLFGDALNSEDVEFGLTIGENFSNLSGIEDASTAATFNLGMFFNIRLSGNWWLHPEILLKSNHGAKGLNPYPTGDSSLDAIVSQSDVYRKLGYINVPILLKYRAVSGFGIEAGPQFSLRRKGNDIFTSSLIAEDDVVYQNEIKDQIKTLDVGIAFGISKQLQKGKGLTLNLRYYAGLVDILKGNNGEAQKNSGFLLAAHIMIGANKKDAENNY